MVRTPETKTERTPLGGASALVAAGAFVGVAGSPGALAAVGVAGAWYLLPNTYAFALGQVALVALVSATDVVPFALAQAGLFGVLLAPATTFDDAGRTALVTALGLAGGGALTWASVRGHVALPPAGLAVAAAVAVAGYGLHRYQLVGLGLAGEFDERR